MTEMGSVSTHGCGRTGKGCGGTKANRGLGEPARDPPALCWVDANSSKDGSGDTVDLQGRGNVDLVQDRSARSKFKTKRCVSFLPIFFLVFARRREILTPAPIIC